MIRYPNITGKNDAQKLDQMKSYLHQLADELNYQLDNTSKIGSGYLSSSVEAGAVAKPVKKDDAISNFNEIKGLIIKSADIVDAYSEEISKTLNGQYVAVSDFGTYKEETKAQLTASSDRIDSVVEKQEEINTDLVDLERTLRSEIEQTAESIKLEVTGGEPGSTASIKLSVGEGDDKKEYTGTIDMKGLVTFSNLANADGTTVINGSNITTGQILADLIKAGVLQSNNGTTFKLDLKNGTLNMDATTFKVAGKSVDEIAAGKAFEAVNSQTQADIFNKLTQNGSLQGLYMENNKLYINASYIKAGEFTATAQVFLEPSYEEAETIKNHILGKATIPASRIPLYDFDNNGSVTITDLLIAQAVALGQSSLAEWSGAIKSQVTVTVNPAYPDRAVLITGTNMWGRYVETVIGANESKSTFASRKTLEKMINYDVNSGCIYRTVDGEKEWLNPLMSVGVEYRTTERWNGYPVWTQIVSCGTLDVGSWKTQDYTGVSGMVLRYSGVCGATAIPFNPFPVADPNNNVELGVIPGVIYLSKGTTCTISGDIYVQVWYVK